MGNLFRVWSVVCVILLQMWGRFLVFGGFGGFLLRMWDGCLAFGAVCAAAAGVAIAQKLRV